MLDLNVSAHIPLRADPPPSEARFSVGGIPVYGDAILSPMEGFSDLPFRSLCRELGSAMSYTEFVSATQFLQNRRLAEKKLEFLPEERPMVFQIFDSEPENLLEVALRLQEKRPSIIDINMGCSTRCVSGRGAGAGLLRTPLKIARIFRRLTAALEIPVTGKIRLGWDDSSRNHVLIARIIEESGGSLVAVHGRSKQQSYADRADWDAIAEVKTAVKIPVVGNGDVSSPADIEAMKAYTGCDGVMIGRAAIGNPWIFSRLDRHSVPLALVRATIERHLEHSLAFYGHELGLILFRKHAARYLKPLPGFDEKRQALLTACSAPDFLSILEDVFRKAQEESSRSR
jgi:tRNA-dihydrouridine synthase B